MTKKLLLLGLSAAMFGGCGGNVEDTSEPEDELRYGRRCYYSYTSERTKSYSSGSSGAAREAQADGLVITTSATPVSGEVDWRELDALRVEAASVAGHEIALTCGADPELVELCEPTCNEHGLHWDKDSEPCDECVMDKNGYVQCPDPNDALIKALDEPWSGEEPWHFFDEERRLTIMVLPPKLHEDDKGELFWQAEVEVSGLCQCACTS